MRGKAAFLIASVLQGNNGQELLEFRPLKFVRYVLLHWILLARSLGPLKSHAFPPFMSAYY